MRTWMHRDRLSWIFLIPCLILLRLATRIQGRNGVNISIESSKNYKFQRLYEWSLEAERDGDLESKASHEQMYNGHWIPRWNDGPHRYGNIDVRWNDSPLEEALDNVHYSMIPPSLDHVAITTIERAYSQSWPRVYVMGLNQGVFPGKIWAMKVWSVDREREALAEAGIVLAEGALPKAFNENFLYLAMTRAEQHLTISYAGSNDEGKVLKVLSSLNDYNPWFLTSPIECSFHHSRRHRRWILWRPYQKFIPLIWTLGRLLAHPP